ncbi:uncharacterized protein N7482_009271 [Penicillium canariense]|uniref:Uncharacterized protein n=1 Tax=Penicillium canariense TaxID=189055 RepID=A0A9W9HMC2_9EURO|nr:uncharacterized protein N7482_009271 [Penicillium canariense]KAJ5152793.1 hypothetical protein N7482_009271 [Penicillium canariense]
MPEGARFAASAVNPEATSLEVVSGLLAYCDWDVMSWPNDPARAVADSGNAVARSSEQSNSVTLLGLKLEFADGSHGIAVATHGFVDVKTAQEPIAHKETSWLAKNKLMILKTTALKVKEYFKMGAVADSPLEKSVWVVQ